MNLDPDISNWVLDFYLRQQLDDRRLNSLLRAFPPPRDSANLHKLLLLKRLEFDVSLRQVSEIALESIERLEDLEFRRGNGTVSDAMRWAYCAAAVESTLKCVKLGHDGGDEYSFFETVKRIWRLRVGRLKKTALEVGLRSDLLWGWKDTMETAVWDDNLRRDVVEKFETAIAVDAVELYLKEERQRMGTSFLEEFAEAMKHDEGLSKLMGVLQDQAASGSNPNKELQKRIDKFRGKRVVRMLSNNSRGVKIVDLDETDRGPSCRNGSLPLIAEVNRARDYFDETAKGPSCRNDSLPGSAEVNKAPDFDETAEGPSCRNDSLPLIAEVNRARDFNEKAEGPSCRTDRSPLSAEVSRAREALKLSSLALRAAVIDPLPEALRAAEAISDAIRQEEQNIPSEGNAGRPESLLVDAAGVAHSIGGVKNAPKPSLMDRNSSARTYEWDDSIDESQEDLARRTKRRLPSPTRLNTSPLRIYEANNVKRRRKGRRWSSAEEDALRAGVATYGKGNWKVILNANRDAFEGRTEVDLKDKWRNLTR